MNVESLKSELQQVLNNDVALRKEFNVLKRSLSDYRNQLIMRDEDCKRLQVTIDVLNTKLVVMERDNTSYKAELSSYKELRGTINEQLQSKQAEIDARIQEIQALRDDLNVMAANYESTIEQIRSEASTELETVKNEYTTQIAELRSNIQYKESGIKEEYENRVSELSNNWSDREQSLTLNHQEQIENLQQSHQDEINALKSDYQSRLASASSSSQEELASARLSHQLAITQMEEYFSMKISALDQAYQKEIESLKATIEEQKNALTEGFNQQIEELKNSASVRENELITNYEQQIEALNNLQNSSVTDTVSGYEAKMAALVSEYEDKLSNTLIHSNSQNSKLHDELAKAQAETDSYRLQISNLDQELAEKTTEIAGLTSRLNENEGQLLNETNRVQNLTSEFEAFKQQASLSGTEQVNELNQQIAALNLSHSDYANELNSRIEELDAELKNLGLLFEATTNNLSETEITLELKTKELEQATQTIGELNSKLQEVDSNFTSKEEELLNYKRELEENLAQELKAKTLEYEKLLNENTNLIDEINIAQDKVESQEHELSILKGELEEVRMQSQGKSEYFKETLSNKNFQITNLEANNAALNQEITHLKTEISSLLEKQKMDAEIETAEINLLKEQAATAINEKMAMQAEIDTLYTILTGANDKIAELENQAAKYQEEIEAVRAQGKVEEQEAFIDRLFKQIDALNDQRMALLDEKEQMAGQLLKMNEVVGNLSQQVESEQIDVTGLNNHRKNVILATNSAGAGEKSQMKEQINDLVREIDKCIELLSA